MTLSKSIGGIALGCLLSLGGGQTPAHAQEAKKFLLQGDMALWTVSIKPDKTTQFEEVLSKLRTALQMSDKPERQQQGKSWKVMRMSMPLPDGNIGYMHVVSPTVPDVDYTVMQILYEAYPDEARSLYDLYREAFVANLSMASGDIVVDLGKMP
jgi:hypothetical protein